MDVVILVSSDFNSSFKFKKSRYLFSLLIPYKNLKKYISDIGENDLENKLNGIIANDLKNLI